MKIMDLGPGEVFGEDYLIYGSTNTYSIQIETTQFSALTIEKLNFNKKYKKMVQPLKEYFNRRRRLIEQIINNNLFYDKTIKKKFYSTVEKGKISAYL